MATSNEQGLSYYDTQRMSKNYSSFYLAMSQKNKLTQPELTELAAYLYTRYEAHKSLPQEPQATIMNTEVNEAEL